MAKPYQFTLECSYLISHLVLGDTDTAEAISKTPLWSEEEKLEAVVIINGVEVDGEVMEKILVHMWEQAKVDSGKEAFNQKVKEEAQRIVKERADEVMEAMNDITNKLHNIDDCVKWNWED